MIKVYTAITMEIDDPKRAISELLEQLSPDKNALKNTIGIVNFHHEFADAGTLKDIADAMPFELAGCVSSYLGTRGQSESIALSITMLTSDDARFAVKEMNNLNDKTEEQIAGELTALLADICSEEVPKLIFPYFPYTTHFTGDNLVEVANAFTHPIPFFGNVAYNMEDGENKTHYICKGGDFSSDTMVLVAFYGEVNPKIRHVNALIYDACFGKPPLVTDADRTTLKSLDGISAVEYLKKNGMISQETNVSLWMTAFIPVIFTYPDDTKIVRQIVGVIEGTEYANLTGFIKPGCTVTFANAEGGKTLQSAEKFFEEMLNEKSQNAVIFSCAGRAWSLGTHFTGEIEKIADVVTNHESKTNTNFNYSLAYSGGEILPVWNNDGKLINTLQNFTLISCSFE